MTMNLYEARELEELMSKIAYHTASIANNLKAIPLHDARELEEFTRHTSQHTSAALHNIREIALHEKDEIVDRTGHDLHSILEKTDRIVANLKLIREENA
jgi:hypothetical protein